MVNTYEDDDVPMDITHPRKARKARGTNNRATKQSNGSDKPPARDKFAEERKVVSPLVPLNEKQAEYIRLIETKKCVISTGYPGASKTYIPTVMACDMLRKGEIKRIYLTRPNISNSKSLGFFSGDHIQKMSMFTH